MPVCFLSFSFTLFTVHARCACLEIQRRLQANESANTQMRQELQKKMQELESIRKQQRDAESSSPSAPAPSPPVDPVH